MLRKKYLVVLLLACQGFQVVFSRRLFVSHDGQDSISCGSSTSHACRSVRFAVNISNSEDEILIDRAQGTPYKECEYSMQSRCQRPIELSKSLLFRGDNGKAVIECDNKCNLFAIQTSSANKTRIMFTNLVLSSSKNMIICSKAKFELGFQQCDLKNYDFAVYTKDSKYCTIVAVNSSFERAARTNTGIWINCLNLTAHFISTYFNSSPVFLQTIFDKQRRPQTTEVYFSNCTFDGKLKNLCSSLLAIKPFAAIVNITVHSSRFLNQLSATCDYKFPTVEISDSPYGGREATLITLNSLVMENNYNQYTVIHLSLVSMGKETFKLEVLNSIFRNNSGGLYVTTHKKMGRSLPVSMLFNNTFLKNFQDSISSTSTIYPVLGFSKCKARVISCRFLDNMPGNQPYAAVVTLSYNAAVTFQNCYFKNTQIITKSLQIYSMGNSALWFRGNNTFNMTALKTEQTIFLHMPSVKKPGVVLKKYFNILCPPGYILAKESRCTVAKNAVYCSYLYTSCEQCPLKTYSLKRGELHYNITNKMQCDYCPRGGQCEGGQVLAKSNFWGFKNNEKVTFLTCPPEYCCDTKYCASYDSCYGNRVGPLCGLCPDGMSEPLFNTKCKLNKLCTSYIFWPGFFCLLTFYLFFFLYQQEITGFVRKGLSLKIPIFLRRQTDCNVETSPTGENNQHHKSSGLVKIIFYYYQIVHVFRNSVGSHNSQRILGKVEKTFSRTLNLIIINVPSFDCPFQNLRPVEKAVILHSVGYCLLVLISLLYVLTKSLKFVKISKRLLSRSQTMELEVNQTRRNNTSLFSVRIVSAFTYISLLMYSSSAQLCLSLLHCVAVGDSRVLFINGSIKCYQPFQYFIVAYVFFSILPFCLVPVLGSYLLKLDRISVFQFCMACILPLPFCCFWACSMLKNWYWPDRDSRFLIEQDSSEPSPSKTAILRVLLGPFRSHKPVLCFPASIIPWEGFLIFRRLVLIIVLTFINDNRLRLMISLIICVTILVCHMNVHPFLSARENVFETLSLSTLIVLCGFTLVKSLYQGEDFSSSSSSLSLLNVFNMVEDILIVTPLAIIIFIVVISLFFRLMVTFLFCIRVCYERLQRLCCA